jgi:hypothetical protein
VYADILVLILGLLGVLLWTVQRKTRPVEPGKPDVKTHRRVGQNIITVALLTTVAGIAQTVIPHSVTLTWTCAANPVPPPPTQCGIDSTGFQVQRGTVHGGPYVTIATVVGPQVFTYVDNSAVGNILIEGSTYFYVVETTGTGGTLSGPSPEVAATIPFLPTIAPSVVSATSK